MMIFVTGGAGSQSKIEFPLVLYAGLILFNLFAEYINRATELILSNPNHVKKGFSAGEITFCRSAEQGELGNIVNPEFSIKNIFMDGKYSILYRLEGRIDQRTLIPINNQPEALMFNIINCFESKIRPCNLEIVMAA
jgi:hypothetical protein